MALTENLNVFLADFGVTCVSGGVTAFGLLDMPSQVLAGDMVLTTDYTLLAKASDFGTLIRGNSITVDGNLYTVRETRLIDDGKFVEIGLQLS